LPKGKVLNPETLCEKASWRVKLALGARKKSWLGKCGDHSRVNTSALHTGEKPATKKKIISCGGADKKNGKGLERGGPTIET